MTTKKDMRFLDHLEELRKRLFSTGLIFLVLFGVAAYYSKILFEFLQLPLLPYLSQDSSFIATTVTSGWIVYLKTAFAAAFVAIIPIVFFETLRFANPGLKTNEKKAAWPLFIFLNLFFFAGLAFAYFVVLPFGYKFMVEIYGGTNIQFLPNIADYLSFTLKFLLAFGIMFDLPFVILLLLASGILKRKTLSRARPFVYVGGFILGALLTPPDYVSQILMAVPFLILFELGMILSWIFVKR